MTQTTSPLRALLNVEASASVPKLSNAQMLEVRALGSPLQDGARGFSSAHIPAAVDVDGLAGDVAVAGQPASRPA